MPDDPGSTPGRGAWRGRPPRHRPPWWPDNESWPPVDGSGHRAWPVRRRGWWPAIGCFAAVFILLALLGAAAVVVQVIGFVFGPLGGTSRPLGVAALVVLVLMVVTLARGFRRLAEPLSALVDAARRVEAGAYDTRVPELRRGPRQLRELTRAFNTMVSRLEIDQRQRRSLLADVSHELRTPLAVLRGNLEALADGVHAADDEHLAGLIEETHVLERLVEDLRTISLAEAGALPLHREPTDPDVLIGETVAAFRAEAERAGISLTIDAPADLPLLDIDPVRIREVIGNLVANALRYTPAGGEVSVAAQLDSAGGQVVLVVADTGSGIEPDVLPQVFERFARGRISRGSGLGLAIARDLVVAHDGTITVQSEPGRGTTFTIRLPTTTARG